MTEVKMIEPDTLSSIGWIRITSIGEENIYFIDEDGNEYGCKVLHFTPE